MRSALFTLLVLVLSVVSCAQEPLMQVASWGFSTVIDEEDDIREAAILTSITNELLGKNTRIAVLNRKIDDLLDKERDEQMNAEYIRGRIARQGVAMGGTHQLVGIVNSCRITEQRTRNSNGTVSVSYRASVTFEVMLIDQATGQNIGGSKTYTENGSSGLFGAGADGALAAVNRRAKKRIANWLMSVLPSDLKVLKVADSTNKGIPTRLLVKGGTDIGMSKGEDLLIVEYETLDDVQVENIIAELNVTEVKSTSSECKIKKGGDAYKAKRDAKAELKILFKPEKD